MEIKKKETGYKIEISNEVKTFSDRARLFILRSQIINKKPVRKGSELWIPKSQIIKVFLVGGDADYVEVKEWFYNKLSFV